MTSNLGSGGRVSREIGHACSAREGRAKRPVAAEAICMTSTPHIPRRLIALSWFTAFILVAVLSGAIATSPGAATTCAAYASRTGVDTNPGTATAPFASVQRLTNALSTGQTGCLGAGTFTGDISLSHGGTPGAPIVITSTDPSSPATIKGRLLTLPGGDWYVFTQLRLDGTNSTNLPSPTIGSDHVVFRNNDITDNHTAICFDLINSSQWGTAHYTTIDSNRIHDCGRLPATNNDHGIYVSGYFTTITNNYIYDNADRGVQLRGSQNGVVQHNVIDGNGEGVIFGDLGANNNDVSHNIVSNSAIRWNAESWWGTGTVGTGNAFHDNCTFASNASSSYDANGGISGGSGYSVASNIVANPGYLSRSAKDFRLQSGSPCAGAGPATGVQPGVSIAPVSPASADTTPPTSPSTLSASNLTPTSVQLNWGAASDNIGVAGYELQDSGVKTGTSSGTTFTATGLACATQHTFGVVALDAAGNRSTSSSTLQVTTTACSVSSGFTTSLTGLQSITLPQTWTFDPGAPASKGYFWVDGVNVATVTGPNPYSYTIPAGSLTSGPHSFGHAWDTTSGVHQTPSSTYTLTVGAAVTTGPVNTAAPVLSGTATLKSWIFVSTGTWTSGTPISYAYQWLRCDTAGNACTTITGAVSSRYNPGSTSKGYRLRARVTATTSSGSTAALSAPSNTL